MRQLLPIALVLCAAIPAGPQTPQTPPFQFTKVDEQLLSEADQLDRVYAKKGLLFENPDLQSYLDQVGKRVLGSRPAPDRVEFHFHVLRDTMVNAFASPNGSIYVTTGLLAILENEAQLASVLGHEATHVYNRHSYLQNRDARKKTLATNIIQQSGSALAWDTFGAGAVLVAAGSLAASSVSTAILTQSVYGYSREMEREADQGGMASIVTASYDPNAMARTFQLLDEDQRLEYDPINGIYRDHPRLTEREAWARDAAAPQPHPPTPSEKEYLAKVAPAMVYNIDADLNGRRARTAVARATRLTTTFPDVPQYQVLLADSYRALGAKSTTPSADEQTRHGQSEHRKEYFKMTDAEEQKILLATPQGAEDYRKNLAQAETLYQGVIHKDPTIPEAHRGLGFLYEQQEKYAASAEQYRAYLALVQGTSLDRLRIERRLVSVEFRSKLLSPKS